MTSWYKKIFKAVVRFRKSIAPGSIALEGAGKGILIFGFLIWIISAIAVLSRGQDANLFFLLLLVTIIAILAGLLLFYINAQIDNTPAVFRKALWISLPLLFLSLREPALVGIALVIGGLIGAFYYVWRKPGMRRLTARKKAVAWIGGILGIAGLLASIIIYIPNGFDLEKPPINAAALSSYEAPHILGASPAAKGTFATSYTTYGSGKDPRRAEFADQVGWKSDSVDGRPYLDNWKGFGGWYRSYFFGVKPHNLPINGRVWYPEGDGPFPLALVVHGNHGMQDFSDPGYDYLGEHLSSRGIILVSVDENFINSSMSDIFDSGLDTENDCRGWLLLEHLKQWQRWNKDPNHAFYQKIDTDNLAVMGHSRGGEAAAIAASFNQLPHYPDDAQLAFNYNFNIKAAVAIAPVDGQYMPQEQPTKFSNTNYLVFHGAYDADVTSFAGARQLERVTFDDSLFHFKTGLYIYGANHGQFNTSWGNNDVGLPLARLLNHRQMLSAEEQQEVAKVYITAFLETSFGESEQFLPLFKDARAGRDWLPENIYLQQYHDSNTETIVDFEEDRVAHTGPNGTAIFGENLSVWKEQWIQTKWKEKGTKAAIIGWHYEDSVQRDTALAKYTISMIPKAVESSSNLVFTLAESTLSSNPKDDDKWKIEDENDGTDEDDDEEDSDESEEADEEKDSDDENKSPEPLDFTITLTDSLGNQASIPLSNFSFLQRRLPAKLYKLDFLTGNEEKEMIYNSFQFPVSAFKVVNPKIELESISRIDFVFDRSLKGVVILDHVGWRK